MVVLKRDIIIFIIFLVLPVKAISQQDTISLDSIVSRITVLLTEYNKEVLFVDTSSYERYGYNAINTNLQIAASFGACNEIIRLYSKGAEINNTVGNMPAPLLYAVASGRKDAVEILLLLGADPEVHDMYGNTPLISAIKSQDLEMAELLIRYGADISDTDFGKSTPLHHAVSLNLFYVTDMLLYYDADTEAKDNEGNTPLLVAVINAFYDIADLLLKNGANPSASDKNGFTPLMVAASDGDTLMMRMLYDAGADLYSFNRYGYDALGYAVKSGNVEAVSFLLDRGKRWNYSSGNVIHPASIAHSYSYKGIIQLLKEHGIENDIKISSKELVISAGGMATAHYQLFRGAISVSDPRLKAGITIGTMLNPFRYRLLVESDNGDIWQYMTNTYAVYGGLYKEFSLDDSFLNGKLTSYLSLSLGYTFHDTFSGSRESPGSMFRIMPSLQINWSRNMFGVSTGIQWLKSPFYDIPPVWFTLCGTVTLFSEPVRHPEKRTRLYFYE